LLQKIWICIRKVLLKNKILIMKNKYAISVFNNIVGLLAKRGGLGETRQEGVVDVEQPGGEIRQWLRLITLSRADFREEVPLTRITRDKEGD